MFMELKPFIIFGGKSFHVDCDEARKLLKEAAALADEYGLYDMRVQQKKTRAVELEVAYGRRAQGLE